MHLLRLRTTSCFPPTGTTTDAKRRILSSNWFLETRNEEEQLPSSFLLHHVASVPPFDDLVQRPLHCTPENTFHCEWDRPHRVWTMMELLGQVNSVQSLQTNGDNSGSRFHGGLLPRPLRHLHDPNPGGFLCLTRRRRKLRDH